MSEQLSQPLYLKYRPQRLDELVGQEIISRTLSNAISINKVAHAYFFTGPRGCGKTSTARILAKSLNCKNGPTASPCGVCQNCLEITSGISPDVIEMDAASHRSVEDATLVIERCHLAPQTAQFKIYIFDEVHMLSKEAFNALLKTIEEPPNNVVFILATTEEHKVPSTIVSRCQRFSFRPIDREPLVARLQSVAEKEKIKLSQDAFIRIAKHSKGGLRDALSLLDQVSILAPPEEEIQEKDILGLLGSLSNDSLDAMLTSLINKDTIATLQHIKNFLEGGVDPLQLMRNLVEHAIEELEEVLEKRKNQSSSQSERLIAVIEQMLKSEYSLRNATQPILKLKSSMLSICVEDTSSSTDSTNNASLLQRISNLEEQIKTLQHGGTTSGFITKEINSSVSNIQGISSFVSKKESETQKGNLKDLSTENEIKHIVHSRNFHNDDSGKVNNLSGDQSGNQIIETLLTHLQHIPTRAALQGAKVFILKQDSTNLYLGIPTKGFFDKLNDPKKIKFIEDTLNERLSLNKKVVLELANPPAESQVQESKKEEQKESLYKSTTAPINTLKNNSQNLEPVNEVKTLTAENSKVALIADLNKEEVDEEIEEDIPEKVKDSEEEFHSQKLNLNEETKKEQSKNPLLNEMGELHKTASHILGAKLIEEQIE